MSKPPASPDANGFARFAPGGDFRGHSSCGCCDFRSQWVKRAGPDGSDVRRRGAWWITLDEPLGVLLAGDMAGSFPPGLTTLSLDAKSLPYEQTPIDVMRHMLSSHALAWHAIKAVRPSTFRGNEAPRFGQ